MYNALKKRFHQIFTSWSTQHNRERSDLWRNSLPSLDFTRGGRISVWRSFVWATRSSVHLLFLNIWKESSVRLGICHWGAAHSREINACCDAQIIWWRRKNEIKSCDAFPIRGKKRRLSSANVMMLSCKHIWTRRLLKVIKMWSQLRSLNDFTLSHVMKFASAAIFLTWFSEECLCLCVSHQEVVRVTWLSPLMRDQLTRRQTQILFPLDHNPVLNLSKRDHTSEHDHRIYLLRTRWRQPQPQTCETLPFLLPSDAGWCLKGSVYGREMTGSQLDRPGVRQLNAPCCSG